MLKKSLIVFSVLLLCVGISYLFRSQEGDKNKLRIGILIPIEHQALREIVAGFKDTVGSHFANDVIFKVQSAEGDLKLQRSILDLFIGQKMDLIVPIGTSATQMTLSLVTEQPIVSLAAQYPEAERQQRFPKNITGVIDEIGAKKKLDFIHQLLPSLESLTLIAHSANEKNFAEIAELKAYSQDCGIQLQVIMVQNLPELETAARTIREDSQGILILKDHLIASGVRMLVNIAKQRGIPIISSDEGTVIEGATLGLGVKERQIGVEGGLLAIKVLEGQSLNSLTLQYMKNLVVFYRAEDCGSHQISIEKIQDYAKRNQVALIQVDVQK